MSGNAAGQLRATAATVVDAVAGHGRSLDAALVRHEARIEARDRPLLRLICYGTLRHHWSLRARVASLLERPLRKRDRVIDALLATAFYQLAETRIPDHAVVSASVEAARLLDRAPLARLVNGVLRRALREGTPEMEPEGEEARYDHPAWLIDLLRSDWPEDRDAVLAANNARAPMWLRVNPAFGSPADYARELAERGIEAEAYPVLPQALKLAAPQRVEDLPGFATGRVSVQDGAAQLAAPWLLAGVAAPDRGRVRVLDACAAPGGKSAHLLELAGDAIDLTCLDLDPARLQTIGENLDRSGLAANLLRGDAADPGAWWDGEPCAAILVDAPCSATGVIRRHPDIKLLRRPDDIPRLAATQSAILDALWPLLVPGGRMLYVTCSVLAAENDAVIAGFLGTHDDARELRVLHDSNIRDLMRSKAQGFQVLPGTGDLDGFYFACLEKVP